MAQKYDVVIVGGGAAGMCAATYIKMLDSSISVALIEQLSRVGKKLITTGNGRCNISNINISLDRYHGSDVSFAAYALTEFDNNLAADFFEQLGIIFTYDEVGRAYPYSLQAASVVDAFRFALEHLGVDAFVETKMLDYKKQNGLFTVKTDKCDFHCKNLILASGLYSGGAKLGSDGSVLKLLRQSGYKTVKTTPAIVQLKTENTVVRSLKGIKVNAEARLIINGENIRSDMGEVLFCDYGLSGPPIMQISREVERTAGDKYIILDLMPEYSYNDICDMLSFRLTALTERKLDEFLSGMLNKRVGQALIKLCGLKLSDDTASLKSSDIKQIAAVIKGMKFKAIGSCGFDSSQVTAGGIDTAQFDTATMMSKLENGLYCIGELLDIDGDCGGFNLQWAWSSAAACAKSVVNSYEVK